MRGSRRFAETAVNFPGVSSLMLTVGGSGQDESTAGTLNPSAVVEEEIPNNQHRKQKHQNASAAALGSDGRVAERAAYAGSVRACFHGFHVGVTGLGSARGQNILPDPQA